MEGMEMLKQSMKMQIFSDTVVDKIQIEAYLSSLVTAKEIVIQTLKPFI